MSFRCLRLDLLFHHQKLRLPLYLQPCIIIYECSDCLFSWVTRQENDPTNRFHFLLVSDRRFAREIFYAVRDLHSHILSFELWGSKSKSRDIPDQELRLYRETALMVSKLSLSAISRYSSHTGSGSSFPDQSSHMTQRGAAMTTCSNAHVLRLCWRRLCLMNVGY